MCRDAVMQFTGGNRRVGRPVRVHPRSGRRLLRVSVLPGTTQQTPQTVGISGGRSLRINRHHRQTQ